LFSRFRESIEILVKIRLTGKVPAEDRKDIVGEIHRAILISLRKGLFKPEMGKPLDAYIAGISGNIIGQYFRRHKKEVITEDIATKYSIVNLGNILSDIINSDIPKYIFAWFYERHYVASDFEAEWFKRF
jgi:hypothetical protein